MPHTPEGGPPSTAFLSDDARAALDPVLDSRERVIATAVAVGCTLVLTDRNLLLVRDGASFRPRSGVQSWAVASSTHVRLTPTHRETARLLIGGAGRSASVFVTTEQHGDVSELVAAYRRRVHREAADEPSRPPA
jgi:hypothetical protein